MQPFLYPLPPGNEVSTVVQLVAWPFGAVAGIVRTLLVLLLLLAQTLMVEGILRILVRPRELAACRSRQFSLTWRFSRLSAELLATTVLDTE